MKSPDFKAVYTALVAGNPDLPGSSQALQFEPRGSNSDPCDSCPAHFIRICGHLK